MPTKRYVLRKYGSDGMSEFNIIRHDDGHLEIKTDKIPASLHGEADALMQNLIKNAGGEHTCEHLGTKDHLQEEVHEHEHR